MREGRTLESEYSPGGSMQVVLTLYTLTLIPRTGQNNHLNILMFRGHLWQLKFCMQRLGEYGTFIIYPVHAFNLHVFKSGCLQRRSRSLSLFEISIHSLENIIMGVSTAFKAMETEKGDDKNSIQRKETKNSTLQDTAECREYPQLRQAFLQGKQAFVL